MNDGLTTEQLRAIQASRRGSVAVLAGPGSGKTHTLAAAVLAALDSTAAADCLCLTFTTKAANNLRSRLVRQAGLFVGTFHALAARLLDRQGQRPPLAESEVIMSLLADLKRQQRLRDVNVRELGLMISRCKNGSLHTDEARRLTHAYDAELTKLKLIDYDDLIIRAAAQAVRQPACAYIFVDEFQDTSPKQYELLQNLSAEHTKLFVIGDPKQSIYRFRGADGSVFERLRSDWQPKTITLTRNFRSSDAVVRAANRIFPEQASQQTVRQELGLVTCIETLDEYTEADYAARTVQQALGGTDWQHTHHDMPRLAATAFQEFAVLYRTRRQGELLADKLRRAGLPVQRLGEDSPYASPLALLIRTIMRCLLEPEEITESEIRQAATLAKRHFNPVWLTAFDRTTDPLELIRAVADSTGQAMPAAGPEWGTSDLIVQLENLTARFQTVTELSRQLDSLADQAFFDPGADAVILSTIHASKGLEFRHVFVAGCDNGLLPNKRAAEPEALAEEQRLFYVAVTRARDSLTLLHARQRSGQAQALSPFVRTLQLPVEVDETMAATKRARSRAYHKRSQQRLF